MTRRDVREPKHTRCVLCGKPRRRPKGMWCLDAWLSDGFCSTECAKAHHAAQPQVHA